MQITPKVMPTKKAIALVESWQADTPQWDEVPEQDVMSAVEALAAALAEAVEAGWETVQITMDDLDIRVEPETGVMVGWFLNDDLAYNYKVDGGETDLHVTVGYLGDVDDLTTEQTRILTGVVAEVASATPAPFGVLDGTGTFENEDGTVWFAVPHIEGLAEFRESLIKALADAGIEVRQDHGEYVPHMTLAYLDEGEEAPAVTVGRSAPFMLHSITVAIAGTRFDVEFADNWDAYRKFEDAEYESNPDVWRSRGFVPFVKSTVEEAKRFTLGPWYIPNEVDAHGDWTDPEELQGSLWAYVRSGYRSIHLQHQPDTQAGEWVEVMTLPWPMTLPVIDPNGNVAEHIYPAGTVLMGVVWEQWAWPMVLAGEITGYSIGGSSYLVDLPAPSMI
jgi:hypothetical protein